MKGKFNVILILISVTYLASCTFNKSTSNVSVIDKNDTIYLLSNKAMSFILDNKTDSLLQLCNDNLYSEKNLAYETVKKIQAVAGIYGNPEENDVTRSDVETSSLLGKENIIAFNYPFDTKSKNDLFFVTISISNNKIVGITYTDRHIKKLF